MKLNELGEFSLIKQLSKNLKKPLNNVVGIGDDAAVIPHGDGFLLLTTDVMVDEVHFKRNWATPEEIGWKSVVVNLSDIAAMGGNPKHLLITLQLPNDLVDVGFVEGVYAGINAVCETYDVSVIGGDTVSSNNLSISITAIGTSQTEPLLRSGAKVGDDVWVSGVVGESFAGLQMLRGEIQGEPRFLEAHKKPTPQVELGKHLLENNLASSCIDISDGLISDATHIAESSNVLLEIDLDYIQTPKCKLSKLDLITGGEDYQLLFTAPKTATEQLLASNFPLAKIGSVKEGRGALLLDAGGLEVSTKSLEFKHF